MHLTLKIRRVITKRLVCHVCYTYYVDSQRRFNGAGFRGRTYFDHFDIDIVAVPRRVVASLTTTGYRSFYQWTDDLRRRRSDRRITRLLDERARDRDWIKRDQASRQGELLPDM